MRGFKSSILVNYKRPLNLFNVKSNRTTKQCKMQNKGGKKSSQNSEMKGSFLMSKSIPFPDNGIKILQRQTPCVYKNEEDVV